MIQIPTSVFDSSFQGLYWDWTSTKMNIPTFIFHIIPRIFWLRNRPQSRRKITRRYQIMSLYFKTALPFCPNFKFAFLSPSLLWIRIKVTKFLDSEKVPTNRKTRKRNGERPNFKSALYYTNNCTYNIYVIKIGWWSEALIMICDAIFPEQIICFVLITITFRAV